MELAFFQFLVDKFTLLDPDPDPHIEWGSGSRRENECGSMRIRIQIHSPVWQEAGIGTRVAATAAGALQMSYTHP